MKKTIINTLIFSFALSFGMTTKAQYTSDFKINAKINAGCHLSANDVNFGVLLMPISDTRIIQFNSSL